MLFDTLRRKTSWELVFVSFLKEARGDFDDGDA